MSNRELLGFGKPATVRVAATVLVALGLLVPVRAGAQEPAAAPSPVLPPAVAEPAVPVAAAPTNAELMQEIARLRSEVEQSRQLHQQVNQLRDEVNRLRGGAVAPVNDSPGLFDSMDPEHFAPEAPASRGETMTSHTLDTGGSRNDTLTDFLPLQVRYRYLSDATGPIAGGTYLQISDPFEEYTLKIQNQVTVDSTNFDRVNMPTKEQGWNIPFGRTGMWGNVTKNFGYQVCFEYFLGQINLLDMFAYYQWDKFKLRFGKGLSPVLYEYYTFDPAFEPVITNSMSFQLANKRPIGTTFIMNGKYLQFWAGLANNLVSGYYDVTRDAQFVTAATLTPFKDSDSILQNLGGGVGYSTGYENYNLFGAASAQPNTIEQTTNNAWVTSSGVPFAVYNQNVSSVGQRTRIAPHLFWYGRFSFLGEYVVHSRELTDGVQTGRSTQNAWMLMASYYLTGERDYPGNGIQAFSSVEPIRPFLPSRGQWGPGAWQVAAQWSQFDAGRADFNRGFIDSSKYTNEARQLMLGLNWWPIKNTRLSADWVWNGFNNPIAITGPNPIGSFNTFWFRYAMFF